MLDPIIKSIEVPCNRRKAFEVFVNDMSSWWPLDQRSASMMEGKPGKALRIEARPGGKIIEIGHDDTEHHWGTIKSYEPFDLLSMDFHIGMPASAASLVEVRFRSVDEQRTLVELTHSNWEAFGDMATMMHGGYGTGWVIIFDGAYKNACGG